MKKTYTVNTLKKILLKERGYLGTKKEIENCDLSIVSKKGITKLQLTLYPYMKKDNWA